VGRENLSAGGCQAGHARIRDIEAIDSELRSVAAVRHVARERGWALRLPDVVDALLDERLRADRSGLQPAAEFLNL
jgi:hypothetical protein